MSSAPLRDPAAERRANRMMIAVLAFVCALLVVRAWVGTTLGGDADARTVHGYGLVFVESGQKAFVSEQVASKAADGTEITGTRWKPAADGQRPERAWTEWKEVPGDAWAGAVAQDARQDRIQLSWPRTVGVWFAALMTLAVLSFLWRDNPVYKFAESIVVGVSAGYWMVVSMWDTLVPKLVGPLAPGFTAANLMPAFDVGAVKPLDVTGAVVSLLLGVLLLCRLSSRAGWLGTFPLAFIVGTFAGLKFTQYVESDLIAQTATLFQPLVVVKREALAAGAAAGTAAPIDWAATVGGSLSAVLVLVGVLSVLAYFFFSVEHKGAVGRTAKVGIWYLMITFGASFGFTVMGRIALLGARFEFLFDDWLWLIDPTGKH